MTPTVILAAFPDATPFWDEVTGCPPEIFAIDRDFRGRSWRDVTATTCIQHSDALIMMDPTPLKYFLPAFLLAALEKPDSTAAEALVYFVCSEGFDAIAPELEARQRSAVVRVVETIMDVDRSYFAEQTDAFLRQLERYG